MAGAPGATTAVAAVAAAAAFDEVKRAANAKGHEPQGGRIESDVCRFYGAVGYTLCATLWDPGSSINMITPAFAAELSKRKGLRWSYCDPVEVTHGSGEGCTSAAPIRVYNTPSERAMRE